MNTTLPSAGLTSEDMWHGLSVDLHGHIRGLWTECYLTQILLLSCYTMFFKGIWLKCHLSQRSTTSDLWGSQRPLKHEHPNSQVQFWDALITKAIIYEKNFVFELLPALVFHHSLYDYKATLCSNTGSAKKREKNCLFCARFLRVCRLLSIYNH